MQSRKLLQGHMAALFTIFLWGTTFISTKVLLQDFQPLEILFSRFLLGFIVLWLLRPQRLHLTWPQRRIFICAGISGITLYFLLENFALKYTTASNAAVITTCIPFITAMLAQKFLQGERLHKSFFLGFLFALTGIDCIVFNGRSLMLNPLGDFLTIMAVCVWGFYSVFSKIIGSYNFNVIQSTRVIFGWGLLFMLPFLFVFDTSFKTACYLKPVNMGNLLFLGLGASAACFVTWNYAVKTIGATKTAAYIYLSPLITVLTAHIVLAEPLTPLLWTGMLLTLAGLLLSENEQGLLAQIIHKLTQGNKNKGGHQDE